MYQSSIFDFDPNPINQYIFPSETSVQPDLNPNPINQGPADVSNNNSIGTPSKSLPLRGSANVLENGWKKKCARTQVEKSESNAKEYPALPQCKKSWSKSCITNFSSDDRALINSWFWKLSFTERCQWLAAYINQVDVWSKTGQQKDGGRLSSRGYFLDLKDDKNVIVCKSMFLSTLDLKSDGMITKMMRAQRQSYYGAIAPVEDRKGSHPQSNKCDTEVICLDINSYNPAICHYKRKNAPCKWYLNPKLSIKEMYKNLSENKENNKTLRPSQGECELCHSYKDHIRMYSRRQTQIPKADPRGSCLFYRWDAKSYCTP